MSNRAVKLLFAAVVLWQTLQTIVTARLGEPYPALVMPGFGGTLADADGNIRFGNVICKVLFQDGTSKTASAYDLLSQAPSSHHGTIMTHMFSPPAEHRWPPQSLKAGLFPGRALSRLQESRSDLDPQTMNWLKKRMEALFPSQKPRTITFDWHEEIFNVNHASAPMRQESVGIREVRFP